jgi:hypothetical protein
MGVRKTGTKTHTDEIQWLLPPHRPEGILRRCRFDRPVTVNGGEHRLVDIDLRKNAHLIIFDDSEWKTSAFRETRTENAVFHAVPVSYDDFIGAKLVFRASRVLAWCLWARCMLGRRRDRSRRLCAIDQSRCDSHTMAHLGAMHAAIWAVRSFLDSAGDQIDMYPHDRENAMIRALTIRHLVEQACTDVLRRLPRAYGPYPLAMEENISRRYQELDLYLRQSHAERDLEEPSLGGFSPPRCFFRFSFLFL